jgi:D-serine deaminase-like pyridoxal phosphate-dependent protein
MAAAWLDGDALAQLDTPAVLVDVDRVDANIERMASFMRARGIALRPHAKTHKSVEVARRQLAAGAIGLTVATIGEAEVFAAHDITDLFVGYPVIATGSKGDRLVRLAERCRLSVGVDSIEGATALAGAFRSADRPSVSIEIDAGGRRSGVAPDAAGALARRVADLGLPVVGVFTHAGHSYAAPDRRAAAADDEVTGLTVAAEALRAEGIKPAVISAGSTPTATLSARPPITEERPGTYVLGDRQQHALAGGAQDQFD